MPVKFRVTQRNSRIPPSTHTFTKSRQTRSKIHRQKLCSTEQRREKRPSVDRKSSVTINNMEDVYRRRLHFVWIFLKDYRQIRGQQRARMRRERRNGLAHISSAHWLPANFPYEPITLRTNQASLERHQVKLLRPIFSLSPRLPSRVSLKVRFTMAIHPLCGIRLALAVRRRLRNVESFLGSKRRLFARKNREFTEGERERERVENEVESRRFQRHRSEIRQFGSHSSHPANSYGANTRNSLWIITKIPDILAYKPC